ncbi:MAG: ABC transporter substrate-binding protein [Deltaproteobacteria bacterium]|nr:ABC transporter substrate-binding protein [Deltaproteobacteria bacterium]
MKVLFDIREFSQYPNSSLVTKRSRVTKNRDEVRRFVRAWTEAIAFMKRRPQETQAILRKYVRLEDPEIIRGTYEFYTEKLPRSPKVLEKDFTSVMRSMKVYSPHTKSIGYEQVFDMTFVEEMERDDFIQSLYR